MKFVSFIIQVLLISLSGVMAPGPVTAATIGKGYKSPHAGALVSIGHGIIEIPLIILIFFGFANIFKNQYIKPVTALFGGIFLIYLSINIFIETKKISIKSENYKNSSLLAGIVLSATNPYFFIWWITAGAAMVIQSMEFGLAGLFTFILAHLMCDFIWLYFLSAFSYKSGKIFGKKYQKALLFVCALLLFIFSIKFIFDGISSFKFY